MTVRLKCLSHTPLRGLYDPDADTVSDVEAVLAVAKKRSGFSSSKKGR